MKNDTTFAGMRSSDHLGDAKMSKKAPRFVEFNFLTNCYRSRHKQFSQIERKRADLQQRASDFLIFAPGLSLIFQSLVMILPSFFFTLKAIAKFHGKN